VSLLKSFYSAIGSHSSDIPDTKPVENPLPPCPFSPNCVRITKKLDAPADAVFIASQKTLKAMKPEEIKVEERNYKINTVFRVFFFRDDLAVQLTQKHSASTYLHIRSASRVGFSDLSVNSRRVKRFLKKLKKQL
jgi:uncharacterized protein (DUF1499 family)